MARGEVVMPPFRNLDDFILGSAKFQLPNFKDLEKWGNRVVQNLFYYQANYIMMGLGMLLVITFMHPIQMVTGAFVALAECTIFYCLFNMNSWLVKIQRNNPLMGIILVVITTCFVACIFQSLLVFLLGILMPVSMIFIHASLRLRNIKNKVTNIGRIVTYKTPMGVFLETLGNSSGSTQIVLEDLTPALLALGLRCPLPYIKQSNYNWFLITLMVSLAGIP